MNITDILDESRAMSQLQSSVVTSKDIVGRIIINKPLIVNLGIGLLGYPPGVTIILHADCESKKTDQLEAIIKLRQFMETLEF